MKKNPLFPIRKLIYSSRAISICIAKTSISRSCGRKSFLFPPVKVTVSVLKISGSLVCQWKVAAGKVTWKIVNGSEKCENRFTPNIFLAYRRHEPIHLVKVWFNIKITIDFDNLPFIIQSPSHHKQTRFKPPYLDRVPAITKWAVEQANRRHCGNKIKLKRRGKKFAENLFLIYFYILCSNFFPLAHHHQLLVKLFWSLCTHHFACWWGRINIHWMVERWE